MTNDELNELYRGCLSINYSLHNNNVPEGRVTLDMVVSVKHHFHGTYQRAQFYITRDTLDQTLHAALYMVRGFNHLVKEAP